MENLKEVGGSPRFPVSQRRESEERRTDRQSEPSVTSGGPSGASGARLALRRFLTPKAKPEGPRTPSPMSSSDDLSIHDGEIRAKTRMTPDNPNWNKAVTDLIISHADEENWAELSNIPLQVNVNRLLHNDRTPLMMFAEKGNVRAVEALLTHPHRINPDKKNSQGDTALHLAASKGHVSVIGALFDNHLPYINARNEKGRTPLYQAARNGTLEAVIALLEKGARIDIADFRGTSPRSRAEVERHKDVSAALKEHEGRRADPDATPDPRRLAGQQLLTEEFANMRARIKEEKSKPREDLLQNVFNGKLSKPDERDVASIVYESEILRYLGKDEINVDRNFSNGLHLGQIGQKYRIDKDEGDIAGFKSSLREIRAEVPAMRRKIENVFVRGDWASVQWTGVTRDGKQIADGFDTHVVEDGKIAVTMLNYSIASTWEENKARWSSDVDPAPALGIAKGVIDVSDPEISDPAIKADYDRLESLLDKKDEAGVSKLIDSIDLAAWHSAGAHPLILAAGKGDASHVERLLQMKASVDGKAANGETALMAAVQKGDTAIVRALLNAGASVDEVRKDGKTALIMAAIHGDISMLQDLLFSKVQVDNERRLAVERRDPLVTKRFFEATGLGSSAERNPLIRAAANNGHLDMADFLNNGDGLITSHNHPEGRAWLHDQLKTMTAKTEAPEAKPPQEFCEAYIDGKDPKPQTPLEVYWKHIIMRYEGDPEGDIAANYSRQLRFSLDGKFPMIGAGHDVINLSAKVLNDTLKSTDYDVYDTTYKEHEGLGFLTERWRYKDPDVAGNAVRDGIDSFIISNDAILVKQINYNVLEGEAMANFIRNEWPAEK